MYTYVWSKSSQHSTTESKIKESMYIQLGGIIQLNAITSFLRVSSLSSWKPIFSRIISIQDAESTRYKGCINYKTEELCSRATNNSNEVVLIWLYHIQQCAKL